MATGEISLNPGSALFPDGTASNLAPRLQRFKSSAGAPMPYFYQLLFDAAQLEQCMFQFRMPPNYVSAPILVVQYKMASAITGNVALVARVSAVSSGDAVDVDAKGFSTANTLTDAVPPTAAGRMKTTTITLTNNDSLAAGDFVVVHFARDGAAGADTAAGDMEVVGLALSYTA